MGITLANFLADFKALTLVYLEMNEDGYNCENNMCGNKITIENYFTYLLKIYSDCTFQTKSKSQSSSYKQLLHLGE